MQADHRFSTLLDAALRGWREHPCDESLLSLAIPLDGIDPLWALPQLAKTESFRMLWDCAPGLSSPRQDVVNTWNWLVQGAFELAQRFCDVTLGRLSDGFASAPAQARPRVLLAFSFLNRAVIAIRTPMLFHLCRRFCPAGN